MGEWNHSIHYHDVLLRVALDHCQRALDVGCGTGAFATPGASLREVIAIDADHDALERGRRATAGEARVRFVEGDVMAYPFGDQRFDLIPAVATLHQPAGFSALSGCTARGRRRISHWLVDSAGARVCGTICRMSE